jgi:hypothetical protein
MGVFILAFFWLAEGCYSFIKAPYRKWRQARTNLFLLFFVMTINAVFGVVTLGVFNWLHYSIWVLTFV